jgi:hypothetical protein
MIARILVNCIVSSPPKEHRARSPEHSKRCVACQRGPMQSRR